jgi:hypothetical protein
VGRSVITPPTSSSDSLAMFTAIRRASLQQREHCSFYVAGRASNCVPRRRAWTKRFMDRAKKVPTMANAGTYASPPREGAAKVFTISADAFLKPVKIAALRTQRNPRFS